MSFQKAERRQKKLKLAIMGPSGSGKTRSALHIAKGLGGKIAVLDTENKSASLYAGQKWAPDFDISEMDPPYETSKYIEAIKAAEKAGYATLIIDSASHQWAGDGGLLQKKEQLDIRGGNSYTNWAKMTPEHEKFKSAILLANINIIITLRSKQDYAMMTNDKGKTEVKKLGMAPIQRDALEYEFDLVFDLDMSHQAGASKDRTGLFDGKFFVITDEIGRTLMNWMNDGSERITQPAEIATNEISGASNAQEGGNPPTELEKPTGDGKENVKTRDTEGLDIRKCYTTVIESLKKRGCTDIKTWVEAVCQKPIRTYGDFTVQNVRDMLKKAAMEATK